MTTGYKRVMLSHFMWHYGAHFLGNTTGQHVFVSPRLVWRDGMSRAEPTPEDVKIIRKNLDRISRWGVNQLKINGMDAIPGVKAMRNGIQDYLEY